MTDEGSKSHADPNRAARDREVERVAAGKGRQATLLQRRWYVLVLIAIGVTALAVVYSVMRR